MHAPQPKQPCCSIRSRSPRRPDRPPALPARALKAGGWLCLLTSSQWLDVECGFKLQDWILSRFKIFAIFESIVEPWFVGARVVTTATILQLCADPDERARNIVRFVQLRQPIADIFAHDGTTAGAVKAADNFRDEIFSLSENSLTSRYPLICSASSNPTYPRWPAFEVENSTSVPGGIQPSRDFRVANTRYTVVVLVILLLQLPVAAVVAADSPAVLDPPSSRTGRHVEPAGYPARLRRKRDEGLTSMESWCAACIWSSAASAPCCGGSGSAICPCGRTTRPRIPQPSKRIKKNFAALVAAVIPDHARGKPIELWWQDEARVGQQGTLTYTWADKGSRPPAPRDCRYSWAYIFGAVCPARGTGAGLVLPYADKEAMTLHLARIGEAVTPGAHAVVIVDGAGRKCAPSAGSRPAAMAPCTARRGSDRARARDGDGGASPNSPPGLGWPPTPTWFAPSREPKCRTG